MRKYAFIFVISLFSITLAACGSSSSEKDDDGNQEEDTITIKHELGEAEVEKNPENVVVFDNGAMETLDKLDIDITGVPKANLPSYLDKFESDDYVDTGAYKEPDFESVSEADPDLILISGRQSDAYDELEKIAPTVSVDIDTDHYMDSFEENMQTIGEIFDKEDEIDEELDDIEQSIDDVNDKIDNDMDKKALILMANEKDISIFGPGSRFGLIHDEFDIPAVDENIEDSTHGQDISFEYVEEKDPDILYVVDKGAIKKGGAEGPPAQDLIENELVENSTAYKNDDIYYLNPEYWYQSGNGLVSVKGMIEEVDESIDSIK